MPELPDITVYVECLERRVTGHVFDGATIVSPFLLRTFDPPIESAAGKRVIGVRRLGKRIVFELEGELFLVLHLMIGGRLIWADAPTGSAKGKGRPPVPRKNGLARFDFDSGYLTLIEPSKEKRASLHVLQGRDALAAQDPGGLEVLSATLTEFAAQLQTENHTLKRALTDPHLFSGIGNAYSDEILHAARLSPVRLTSPLTSEAIERLYHATQDVLTRWTDQLRREVGLIPGRSPPLPCGGVSVDRTKMVRLYKEAPSGTGTPAAIGNFPKPSQVTAFRPGFAVHGKFGQPCPVCGTPVQRIRYAGNETNYCPRCQTEGKVLADRSLSRLLHDDWPRTIEELEAQRGPR